MDKDRERVFESIRKGGFKLKHVETNDKTKINFKRDYKDFKTNRRYDRRPMFNELLRGRRLKHVEPKDKTKLNLEKGYKLRKHNRKALLDQINKGNFKLKKAKTNDRSAPSFERYGKVPIPKALLKDVTKGSGNKLHHVNTVDKSRPMIEKDVRIHKIDRKPFLGEVKEGVHLNHVETCDKTKPQIPRNFHLQKVDRAPKRAMDDKRRLDMEKGKGLKTSGSQQKRTGKFI